MTADKLFSLQPEQLYGTKKTTASNFVATKRPFNATRTIQVDRIVASGYYLVLFIQ